MEKRKIYIFDTTLRDGEQSPGCSMNLEEKLKVAAQLEALGVDVIEAGFAIASEGDFAGEVDALAARLAASATVAISLTKRLLNGSLDQDRNAAFLAEAMAQEIIGTTEDVKEGVASFLEKRPSNFKGQ